MVTCPSCGTENTPGTHFCVNCGTTLPDTGSTPGTPGYAPPPTSDYTPTGGSSAYSQPQPPQQYNQPQAEPPHPGLAAVVSLFFPGMGLLFVPNKQSLGIWIFVGTILGYIVLMIGYFLFSAVTCGYGALVGLCFLALPLWNLAAAIHSYDEAAKASRGKFNPLVFK